MAPQALSTQKHSIQQLHIRFDTSYYVNEGGREGLQLCSRPWGLAAERRKSHHRQQERAGISPAVTCSVQRWATPLNNQHSVINKHTISFHQAEEAALVATGRPELRKR